MKQENIDFLEANRHHYDTLIKAFYLRNLNAMEREGMQRVMAEEFAPGYRCDLWCPPCVVEMVKLLYANYDNWLANNQAPSVTIETAPEPIKVKANFPKHDKINPPPDVDTNTSDAIGNKMAWNEKKR